MKKKLFIGFFIVALVVSVSSVVLASTPSVTLGGKCLEFPPTPCDELN